MSGGWLVIHTDDFVGYLNRAAAGEDVFGLVTEMFVRSEKELGDEEETPWKI